MKRIICFILCIGALFFSSCSNGESIKKIKQETSVETSEDFVTIDEGPEVNIVAPVQEKIDINEPDKEYPVPKYVLPYLGENVMPLVSFVGPPSEIEITQNGHTVKVDNLTDKTFADYAGSGLNTMIGFYDSLPSATKTINRYLDFCDKYKLAFITNDDNKAIGMDSNAELLLNYKDIIQHPSFAGTMIIDEPGTNQFDMLGKMMNAYKNVLNSKICYYNLLSIYSGYPAYELGAAGLVGGQQSTGNTITYEEYLRQFIEKCKPKYLSYDFYPMRGNPGTVTAGYYENMSIMNSLGKEYGIPFWVFVQCCKWNEWNNIVRKVNQSEVLWQINNSLCYGAKGFSYFMYYEHSSNTEKFQNTMVNKIGEKQDTYYFVQKANKQIKAVDEYMINSQFKGIMQMGNTIDPIPDGDKLDSYGCLESASAGDYLIGCFDYNGKDCYYIADAKFDNSKSISLQFNDQKNLMIINDGIKQNCVSNKLDLSLEAGGGILIIAE